MIEPDTNFFRCIGPETKIQTEPEVVFLRGETDGIKGSNLHGVVIRNKTFLGHVKENDIDLVRGSEATIGPNIHKGQVGVSNITVKGGFDGLHLRGNFGTLEFGQFSIYDKWFALPKSKNLTFDEDAKGTVTVWYAEKPKHVPAGVKIIDRRLLAYPYFVWRSLQMTLSGQKAVSILALLALCGCAIAPKPQQGGRTVASLGGDKIEAIAPENPQTPTTQKITRTTTRKFTPSSLRPPVVKESLNTESPIQPAYELKQEIAEEVTTQEVVTTIGSAQKDTSREMAAKLAAMRPMQYLGFALIVAALAMFHPAVRALTAFSREMQMMTAAAGFVLIYAPSIIAGNEWLILVGLGAVFVFKRLSYLKGKLDASDNSKP